MTKSEYIQNATMHLLAAELNKSGINKVSDKATMRALISVAIDSANELDDTTSAEFNTSYGPVPLGKHVKKMERTEVEEQLRLKGPDFW